MRTEDFRKHVQPDIDRLRAALAARPLQVSDVQDADGRQYIDVVLEGGGVLGVALVGYLYALEQAGIRFLGVGGTSAGSIVALMLGACGNPQEERAEKLIGLVSDMPVDSFQDGDDDANDFIKWMLEDSSKLFQPGISLREAGAWMSGVSKILQIRDNLHDDLGLCVGQAFFHWTHERLAEFGTPTAGTLRERMQPAAGSLHYVGDEPDGAQRVAAARARLCLVAADVTTERKVQFPDDTPLYFADNPDALDPAHFVRASMSVPFFFHPKRCPVPPGPQALAAWNERIPDGVMRAARYNQPWPPAECLMVDGGIMSNFPIDAFHLRTKVPTRPTFGVKLEVDRAAALIDSPLGLLMQLFNSARHCRDNDFIETNPDYNALVQSIDTGSHNWLDFHLSDAAKLDLFLRGVRSAVDFLTGTDARKAFSWANYKEVRRALVAADEALKKGMARA